MLTQIFKNFYLSIPLSFSNTCYSSLLFSIWIYFSNSLMASFSLSFFIMKKDQSVVSRVFFCFYATPQDVFIEVGGGGSVGELAKTLSLINLAGISLHLKEQIEWVMSRM